LRVRRFYCRNAACPRRTFAERVPQLVAPFARRTRRLAEAQGRTGAALGGEAGARLLSRLSMPASADTVPRLLNRLPLPDQTPRHRCRRLGGAGQGSAREASGMPAEGKRRGRSHGTIVVDLERRRVVGLLPDRTAATLAGWLRQRPGIEVVARDRSTECASAIRDGGDAVPARRTGPFPCSAADEQGRADSRERRLALYGEVQRRQAAGEPLIAIARAMKLARGTVRNYAPATSFPERGARRPGHGIIDQHLPHLQARGAEGCEGGAVLWRALQARGLTGTARLVRRWLSERRQTPARTAPHRWRGRAPANPGLPDDSTPTPLPAARQLAWLLVQPAATLPAVDAAAVARTRTPQLWPCPPAGSPPWCVGATSATKPAPWRPVPNWMPGSPKPASVACRQWKRLLPG